MENHNILVSIICNTYNHEKYIRQTLMSFVKQKTSFKYEILIHDDASTDTTPQIISEIALEYPEIIFPILQKINQYSKNIKINKVYQYPRIRGKYIALCEGDDYWTDNKKLQTLVDFLESHEDFSGACHGTQTYNCSTKNFVNLYKNSKKNEIIHFKDAIRGYSCHTSSIVYRSSLLPFPNYFDIIKSVGDYQLVIYLTMIGKLMYFGKTMSQYRLYSSPSSWTSDEHGDCEMQFIYFLEELTKHVNKQEIKYCAKEIKHRKCIYLYNKHQCRKIMFTKLFLYCCFNENIIFTLKVLIKSLIGE